METVQAHTPIVKDKAFITPIAALVVFLIARFFHIDVPTDIVVGFFGALGAAILGSKGKQAIIGAAQANAASVAPTADAALAAGPKAL